MPDDANELDVHLATEAAPPPCPSRPALALAARSSIFIATDSGAWFRASRGKSFLIHRLPDLDGASAPAVDSSGTLWIGLFDGVIATPRDDEWAYHATDAVVLSVAATPWGLALGDASGTVSLREPPAPPIAKVALGEAVVELMPFDQGIVALGASGGLWRIEQPQGGVFSAAAISTHTALGRPVGLFSTGNGSKVGVFSPERLALLSRGASRLTVGIRRFADGIDKVVPLGAIPGKADSPLGLLTDAGDIWLVDAELKASSRVDLPGGANDVVGLAAGPLGSLLAWTAGGSLFSIRDRSVQALATADVATALAGPDSHDQVVVVYWVKKRTLKVSRFRPGSTR